MSAITKLDPEVITTRNGHVWERFTVRMFYRRADKTWKFEVDGAEGSGTFTMGSDDKKALLFLSKIMARLESAYRGEQVP